MPLIEGKMMAQADIDDWYRATMREEVEIKDAAAMLKLVEEGMPSGQIVRHAIVNQELRGEEDLLGTNKCLLYSGGRAALAERVSQQRETVHINGHAYEMPKYIGTVRERPENGDGHNGNGQGASAGPSSSAVQTLPLDLPNFDPGGADDVTPPVADVAPVLPISYTSRHSQQAMLVARAYLRRQVPGHIMPRLVILKEHGEDVRAAAEEIKAEIDAMVSRLA